MKRGRGENKNSLLHQYREDVQWLKGGEFISNDEGCDDGRKGDRKWEHHSNICSRASCSATVRVTEPLVQKMVEMEERLTARIGASSAHHSSGTHGNNHQLCRLRDVWIHICIPVTSIKILMQRNGTSRSLIGMFLNVLCYRQQIYILGGKDGCRG